MSIPNEIKNDMEKVSIITPCFNAEVYINETYQCLKGQTYQNWEWIVFDDCSTDNSFMVLQNLSIQDKRVKPFKNGVNSGAAVTRNNCLNKATGKYLAFLDCDDLWNTEKLTKQINFINKNKASFVYSDYQMINDKGDCIKTMKTPTFVSKSDLLKFNPFATSSVLILREAVEKNGIRFLEHLRRRQDYLFWYAVISKTSNAIGINEALSKYRIVGSTSLSANKKKMAIIQWQLYRNEFGLNLIQSSYYFIHYAIHGIKKYFFK